MDQLAREGYDHRLGARPLQRVIEQRVAIPLARWRVDHLKLAHGTLHISMNEAKAITVKYTADSTQ